MVSTGHSPVVCPGGAQEVTYLDSDQEMILYLRSRFGLVKLACQYGETIGALSFQKGISCYTHALRSITPPESTTESLAMAHGLSVRRNPSDSMLIVRTKSDLFLLGSKK